jgi:hypothetical protein
MDEWSWANLLVGVLLGFGCEAAFQETMKVFVKMRLAKSGCDCLIGKEVDIEGVVDALT